MKKIFCFVFITIMLMTNSVCLYASEEQTEYTYTIDMFSWETKYSNGSGYRSAHEVKGTIRSAYKIVAYREISFSSTIVKFYFYDSSGNIVYECNQFLQNMKNYVSWSGTCESGKTDLLGVFKQDDEYSLSNNLRGTCYWKEDDYMNPDTVGRFVTSIPIFNSSEEAKKFISGELTEKDALNYESDLCNIVYDLEVPQNLQCVGMKDDELSIGNLIYNDVDVPQLSFKWEQTDPNHTKWSTEIYCYENFRYRKSVLLYTFDEWFYVDDYFLFSDTVDTYKKYWNQFMKKSVTGWSDRNKKYDEDDFETLLTVLYFRNAWYDSDSGLKHYSNWVKVEYDWSSGDVITSYYEIEGSDIEINDSTGAISKPSGDVITDSQYTGTDYDGYMEQSSSDLLGWIKTGFGLGGENGVIALLGETFSFIPPELWSVFLAGISLFVVVAVVKFIRG